MEIQYQKDDDEDEFVMVERVSDSLRVLAFDEVDWPDAKLSAASTETSGRKNNVELPDSDGQARYSHIPAVPTPKVMQTPQNIPPLYPYSRTNVYILISPEAAQGTIKSVILKGSSPEEPFELEIPIEVLSERGEIIHQLAAKKAVKELEDGRGWLVHAKDENGVLMKEKYSDCFQSMVEREAVRLGVEYQIAGKFTSFVATETDSENSENTVPRRTGIFEEADTTPVAYANYASAQSSTGSLFGASVNPSGIQGSGSAAGMQRSGGALFSSSSHTTPAAYAQSAQPNTGSLFGASVNLSGIQGSGSAAGMQRSGGALFSSSSHTTPAAYAQSAQPNTGSLFGARHSKSRVSAPFSGGSNSLFGSATGSQQSSQARARMSTGGQAPRKQLASMAASPFAARMSQDTSVPAERAEEAAEEMDMKVDTKVEETDPLQKIIALQTFEGYWNLDAPLLEVVGLSAQHKAPQGVDSKVWAAVLAITFLERKMAGDKEAWEMVVEKARGWLEDVEKGQKGASEEMWTIAEQLITGAK